MAAILDEKDSLIDLGHQQVKKLREERDVARLQLKNLKKVRIFYIQESPLQHPDFLKEAFRPTGIGQEVATQNHIWAWSNPPGGGWESRRFYANRRVYLKATITTTSRLCGLSLSCLALLHIGLYIYL